MNISLILKTKFLIITCIIVSNHCGTCQVSNQQEKSLNDKNYNLKKPVKAELFATCNTIIWKWQGSDNANGYKYNFENDLSTAIDIGEETSFLAGDLVSDTEYKFFVWAYNDSCISEVLVLEKKTEKWSCGCKFVDQRDMQIYRTVEIGNQCWMAQNLNFKSELGSYCYNNSEGLCNIYGKFYSYQAATQSCPNGWKLPSLEDVEQLINYVGDSHNERFDKLVEHGYTGFDMKLGGQCGQSNTKPYIFLGTSAGIWTSTTTTDIIPSNYILFFGDPLGCRVMSATTKKLCYFVRCIKE
ncbi:MAG: FISUMP domain-containing protein [Bacteroidales bacterium]